ncbi:hypothetical protein F0562_006070 [Nyssa sinensis]|uniref:Uncharacterized protein n=1 Tax=Nyssa sinensis TaxID=561372 RepID=A0A5J5AQL3_9ASTE|nr:hypothetical protein F0562_006070 [Nyssa sinensis]
MSLDSPSCSIDRAPVQDGKMHFAKLDDSPMFRQQIQCMEENAEIIREKSLKFYKGCRKYTFEQNIIRVGFVQQTSIDSDSTSRSYWSPQRRVFIPSSNSAAESQSSTWQYSPNPALQNNLRGTGRPHSTGSSNQGTGTASGNYSKSRQQTPSRFGGNIHTLKRDEGDSKFNNRNAFWNGNSTQNRDIAGTCASSWLLQTSGA